MYKTFIESLDRAGIQLPIWFFVAIAVVLGIGLLSFAITKFIVPAILRIVDIYTDINSIKQLKNNQMKAIEKSIETDNKIENELFTFMAEMRTEIKTLADNRTHDREQNLEVQKELTNSIKMVSDRQQNRDIQIEALMCGTKELLGNAIDERYARYVSLKGIPENEVDDFDDIYAAYRKLHGNHGRETKYNYVKDHLQVIPVETKLVTQKSDS